MRRKLLIIGLVLLLLHICVLNRTTTRIVYSNRSTVSKIVALSKYLIVELFELLWKIVRWAFELLWDLGEWLIHLWHLFFGSFSPGYDIRSNQDLYLLYQRVSKWSGLPWQVFWGIHAEETSLGRNLGNTQVVTVLPANQVKYFQQICRDLHWDPDEVYGSHKGAIGPFQFIPETWVRNAVDGNGDGRKDPFNLEDAAYSAANYLVRRGGLQNLSKALWHYNQDNRYVRRVLRYLDYEG